MTKRQRVGVVFGGRNSEHEVSLTSARSVMQALEEVEPASGPPVGHGSPRLASREAG